MEFAQEGVVDAMTKLAKKGPPQSPPPPPAPPAEKVRKRSLRLLVCARHHFYKSGHKSDNGSLTSSY